MQDSKRMTTLALIGLAVFAACIVKPAECQSVGAFGSSRPASVIFEPTMSFIRQNMQLVTSYVALFRSIFVGAFERPLVTSTDAPPGSTGTRITVPRVPAIDFPGNRGPARLF